VTGDGGFGQYAMELTTAVKYKMPIKHVLLNNSELGKISKEQRAGHWPVWQTALSNPSFAKYAEDCGAQGIVVPHVDDVATAEQMAMNCRYPPLGKRSVTGVLPQLDFAPHPIGDMAKAVDAATLLVIMLETPQAIANADAIAAIPGVDVLLIGTNDLCMEMGIPGQVDHPDVQAAYRTVVEACDKHGKHAGMGGVYKPEQMKPYLDMGVRMVLTGSDLGFLIAGAKGQATAVRNLIS